MEAEIDELMYEIDCKLDQLLTLLKQQVTAQSGCEKITFSIDLTVDKVLIFRNLLSSGRHCEAEEYYTQMTMPLWQQIAKEEIV